MCCKKEMRKKLVQTIGLAGLWRISEISRFEFRFICGGSVEVHRSIKHDLWSSMRLIEIAWAMSERARILNAFVQPVECLLFADVILIRLWATNGEGNEREKSSSTNSEEFICKQRSRIVAVTFGVCLIYAWLFFFLLSASVRSGAARCTGSALNVVWFRAHLPRFIRYLLESEAISRSMNYELAADLNGEGCVCVLA